MGGGVSVDKRHRLLLCQRGGDATERPLHGHGQPGLSIRSAVQEVIFTVRTGREFDTEFGERFYQVLVLLAGATRRQRGGRERVIHLRPQSGGKGRLRVGGAVRALDGHGEPLVCRDGRKIAILHKSSSPFVSQTH